ncbi:MAG: RrF2 family transcriptional regulator [bacterium]
MPIIFTKGCEYALQSVLYLASMPDCTPVFQRDISTALMIPPHFLGKVLQALARNGLVTSQKGKTGGFVLSKAAKDISPYDIIAAIDGPAFLNKCVVGFPGCDDATPCPMHDQWKKIKQEIVHMLKNKNLEQLSKEMDIKLESIKKLNPRSD